MKFLYLASNPPSETNLKLEREVSALQRALLTLGGGNLTMVFLPDLPIEEFSTILRELQPDILHIAAHSDEVLPGNAESADGPSLMFAGGAERRPVRIAAHQLRNLFSEQNPPRLVFVNACDSQGFAEGLTMGSRRVLAAIGSTAKIMNGTARAAALGFYSRLLGGDSLKAALDAAKADVELLEQDAVSLKLFPHGVDETPVPKRRIAAMFIRDDEDLRKGPAPEVGPLIREGREYKFRLYISAAHPNTSQVVFFTDDPSFIDKPWNLEADLSLLVRGVPDANGDFMAHEEPTYWWSADGNHRLFAVGITPARESYALSGSLLEALRLHYEELHPEERWPDVDNARRRLGWIAAPPQPG